MTSDSVTTDLQLAARLRKMGGTHEHFTRLDMQLMYDAADQVERLSAALRELVECKDLKYRIECWEASSTQELAAMAEEYDRRKPKAWEVARLLVTL